MDIDQRIAQFQNMCREDPDNDMAHFSLGNAYLQNGQPAEAAEHFLKCCDLNESMSKAYQLAGEALIAAGQPDEAASVLERGFVQAAARGDRLPMNAMGELLDSLGRPRPEIASDQSAEAIADTGFVCARTGRPGTQLPRPPFKGPIGQWIHSNIAKETFDAWIAQGTKVINELRLDLSRDEDAAVYDEQMYEYLGIDHDLRQELAETDAG